MRSRARAPVWAEKEIAALRAELAEATRRADVLAANLQDERAYGTSALELAPTRSPAKKTASEQESSRGFAEDSVQFGDHALPNEHSVTAIGVDTAEVVSLRFAISYAA